MSIGFARDGHVLDLALERFALQDLPDEERRAVKAHLRECELCRGRADLIRLDLSVALPPLDATRAGPPPATATEPELSWMVYAAVGGGVGLVVLVLLALLKSC